MSRRTVVAILSVGAHAVAVVALIIAGLWNIEKLDVEGDRTVYVASAYPTPRPMAGGGDGELPPLKKKLRGNDGHTKLVKKAVSDVQPGDVVEEDKDAQGDDSGSDDGADDGSVWGHELGAKDGTGTGIFKGDGKCPMPICGMDVIPDDVDIPEVEIPTDTVVTPDEMDAQKISGNEHIQPPDSVKTEMVRAGESKLVADFKICVDTAGRVRDLSVVRSTGYRSYDDKLMREMKSWRYRRFTINGTAVPACSMVHVIYRFK
jgi:hypothetical protein